MGDVFRRRCGCGAVVRLRESCAACADRRRAELRASGIAESELWERINRKSEQTHARAILLCLTAPARWAAEGVVGVHRARRDYERKHKQPAGDLAARPFQVGDRVRWAANGDACGTVTAGKPNLYDLYVDASEVKEGDRVRCRGLYGFYTGVVKQYRGVATDLRVFDSDDDKSAGRIQIREARDIQILERAK